VNKLPVARRAQILGILVEVSSLRATSRLAECSINSVTKLLVDVGRARLSRQGVSQPYLEARLDEFQSGDGNGGRPSSFMNSLCFLVVVMIVLSMSTNSP
jgi:hypothetical protein